MSQYVNINAYYMILSNLYDCHKVLDESFIKQILHEQRSSLKLIMCNIASVKMSVCPANFHLNIVSLDQQKFY